MAEVLQWLREGPQRSALEQFWSSRQAMMEALSRLVESDTPAEEIEIELRGTINAIEARARLVNLLAPAVKIQEPHDWLPLTEMPRPCQETYGEIFRKFTDRCLDKMLGPRPTERAPEPEHTDA